MYNDKVMEIFKNPKNVGRVQGANAIGKVGNVQCGDIMKLYLRINDENVIEDASFETFGCAAAIVSSSIATEMIKGKTVDQALKLKNEDIIAVVGELPAHKIHCSVLATEAIEDAIKNYRKKQSKSESVKNTKNASDKKVDDAPKAKKQPKVKEQPKVEPKKEEVKREEPKQAEKPVDNEEKINKLKFLTTKITRTTKTIKK